MIYHCKMDDGTKLEVEAESAADAIQEALESHRGHCVIECFAGSKLPQKNEFKGGYIDYDIPKHQPLLGFPSVLCEDDYEDT